MDVLLGKLICLNWFNLQKVVVSIWRCALDFVYSWNLMQKMWFQSFPAISWFWKRWGDIVLVIMSIFGICEDLARDHNFKTGVTSLGLLWSDDLVNISISCSSWMWELLVVLVRLSILTRWLSLVQKWKQRQMIIMIILPSLCLKPNIFHSWNRECISFGFIKVKMVIYCMPEQAHLH